MPNLHHILKGRRSVSCVKGYCSTAWLLLRFVHRTYTYPAFKFRNGGGSARSQRTIVITWQSLSGKKCYRMVHTSSPNRRGVKGNSLFGKSNNCSNVRRTSSVFENQLKSGARAQFPLSGLVSWDYGRLVYNYVSMGASIVRAKCARDLYV